ncbi:hypothetical protein Ahy_B05g077906 [Arachis hypogaea]|uniref:Protein FAR1-RELATED SEQUENCE n=1 Tax=Arachis hypogaea TaxID=3818 RepID=A0A444Z5V5_ARAHY|nr:hypothetical protein Ahy_B05g077906 [Arachis hypogaea]
MENDGKESYKDGNHSEYLNFEYEYRSDENDDIMDVTIDKAEVDTINIDKSQVCEFYAKCYRFVSQKDLKTEKDIGSTFKRTIGKGSLGQLLVSIARLGFVSFVTIGRKYGLAKNEWVQDIYNDKMKWATTYLTEHFFGRIRTTSQCKEIHSLLKNYVDSKTSLLEFMHKFSEVLRHYRNNHLTTDFDTFYKCHVLATCLKSFKKQATEVYTRNIFKLVKDEIEAAGVLNVTECPNNGDIDECNTKQDSADDIVHTLRCGAMASICWKLCDISSKNSVDYRKTSSELLKLISKVRKKKVMHKRVFPPLIRCSKEGSERLKEAKICTLLVKKSEDSPTKYSNTEDELMILLEECETSKQTHSQDTKSVKNSWMHNNNNFKTEEITLWIYVDSCLWVVGFALNNNACTQEMTNVIKLMYDHPWPSYMKIPAKTREQ